jgi:hypothetical protein
MRDGVRTRTLVVGMLVTVSVDSKSDHETITAAGWAYRTNERGWLIYREPDTGRWHTRDEAIRKLIRSAELAHAMHLAKSAVNS